MHIKITARHVKLTDAIADYATKKVEKAEKFFDHIVRAQVILSVEKRYRQSAEIIIHASSKTVFRAKEESTDLYAAIDLASDKIDKQLKRLKERSKGHRKGRVLAGSRKKLGTLLSEKEPEEKPGANTITEIRRFDVKPETVDEAISEMELRGFKLYMFLNAGSSTINVLYRRDNGTLGIIEPDL